VQIKFAHLCDYAFVGNGKLGMIGIFDQLNAPDFPHIHPFAFLVIGVQIASAEVGKKLTCAVQVRDEDGATLAHVQVEIQAIGTAPPGTEPSFNQILPMQNMQFPKPGRFEFAFFLNDRYEKSISLTVAQVKGQKR
jgi:hypothetical protein